jgi:hypothetical protein
MYITNRRLVYTDKINLFGVNLQSVKTNTGTLLVSVNDTTLKLNAAETMNVFISG